MKSPRVRRSIHPSEHDEQSALVEWFRLKYPDVIMFAIPNGGLRNKVTAAKLKAEGVLPGVPDLFIPRTKTMYVGPGIFYAGLFIEMKSAKGKVSPEQAIIIEKLRAADYMVEVCRSADEAMRMIDEYLS